ncbi:MAG: right-handed parallel beta-helix repeat-containing protein, partial [Sandaracinaceae bacterium]
MKSLLAAASLLAACLLTLAVAAPAEAQTTIPGGNIINQTWTVAGSPYTIQGDITVPTGAFLTIQQGVEVRLATSDAAASGTNTSRVELIVDGTLTVSGTAAEPVTFDSTTGSGIGSWEGIFSQSGATVTVVGAVIRNARYGLHASGGTTTIDASTLSRNTYGVYATTGGDVAVTDSLLTNNSPYGAYTTGSGSVTLDHCTVHGNIDGVYLSGGTATVLDSVIANNSDDGVDQNSGSASVTDSNVWNNGGVDYEGTVSRTRTDSANPLFVSAGDLRLTS